MGIIESLCKFEFYGKMLQHHPSIKKDTKKSNLKWKSDDHLNESPRRRLHLASVTVVKSTKSHVYLAFFDTESDREEIAIYSNTDPSHDQAQDPNGFAISAINTNVFFDAWQLDPGFPIYSDGIFVNWIATKVEFKSCGFEIKENFVSKIDHFAPDFYGSYFIKFLKNFEGVPTSFSGHMEFYGYFKSAEDDFNRFIENLKVSCSFRSTKPQCLIVNKIYATTILLEDKEGIGEKKVEKVWTRVKCTKIFSRKSGLRKFILADLLETGETSKKVLIKDLITIPDYIACQPTFVKRFHLVGCRSVKPEDFNGDVEKHDQELTRSYKFLQEFFGENDNIIKCLYGF